MIRDAQNCFFTADDGLDLHYLDFRPEADHGLTPAVCLPGLTRSAMDFEVLARALAFEAKGARRVVAFDYRGRGRSAHDPDWRHYDLPTERADFLKGLALMGIDRAHFIGTSRGGLHVMALAATNPEMIRSAVLNDIGPKMEVEGLRRIKNYVGKPVAPQSLEEAVKLLKVGNGAYFDGLSEDEWRTFATTTFGRDETDLRLRSDPQLAHTLDGFDLTKPLPESWDLFDALRDRPVLTIRGAGSDLFSPETLATMGGRWPSCETMVVPGQGHAPLLADARSIGRIRDFLHRADPAAQA